MVDEIQTAPKGAENFKAGAPSGTFTKPVGAEKPTVKAEPFVQTVPSVDKDPVKKEPVVEEKSAEALASEESNKPAAEVKSETPIPPQPDVDQEPAKNTDPVTKESPTPPAPELTESEAKLAKMSPGKRTEAALWTGVKETIKKACEEGGYFDQPGREEAKKDAEVVLKQAEQGPLDSDGLKLYFKTLNAIGGEAAKVGQIAAEYLKVRVTNGTESSILAKKDWDAEKGKCEQQLEEAKKPKDGTPVDENRVKELEDRVRALSAGEFGYEEFPEMPASLADVMITKKREELEAKKVRTEDEEKLLISLRLAKATERGGLTEEDLDLRIIIKDKALRHLAAVDKTSGAEKIIDDMKEDVLVARVSLNKHLEQLGWNRDKIIRFNQGLDSGDINAFAGIQEIPGLKKAFFGLDAKGQEITDEELRKILDPEGKKKGTPLLIQLLLLLGVSAVMEFKQALPPTGQ